jgi:hypothetical protein
MRTALCALFLAAMAAEDSPLPAPTAEEGALLEFVNAHRCQRFAYDPIIIRMLPKFAPSGQFLASYIREPSYPQQALVANPKLAAAARELLRSGAAMPKLGHPEAPTERFGYPAKPLPPLGSKEANLPGAKVLVVIMRQAKSAESAYAESMMTVSEATPDGSQYLTSRRILGKPWQEVGIAIARSAQGVDVAMVYGMGTGRVAGGMVYADANRNLRYDLGEGLAGVVVACGGSTMTTEAGGIWWASLPDASAGSVVFEVDGMKAERPYDAKPDVKAQRDSVPKPDNVVIDWRVPSRDVRKQVDDSLEAANKASAARKPEAEAWPAAMVDLFMGTLLLDLDSGRQEQVNALVQPIADEFTAMRRKFLAMLDEDPKAFAKELETQRKNYPGQAARWFKEVQSMAVLRKQVVLACTPAAAGKAEEPRKVSGKQAGKPAKMPIAALWEELAKAKQASCDPVLRRQYESWELQLATTPEASAGAPPKEPPKRK